MPRIIEPMLMELEQESAVTRRVLDRVPADKFGWKPHAKSMSLGQLANHIADSQGKVAEMLVPDSIEFPVPHLSEPASSEALLATFDASVAKAQKTLGGFDDEKMRGTWRVLAGGNEVMAMPRVAVVRMIVLNHSYHHRGQLTVYLRELDVPVPSVYGPSADENPFAS